MRNNSKHKKKHITRQNRAELARQQPRTPTHRGWAQHNGTLCTSQHRAQAKTTRRKTHFQLTCVDKSGRAALCSVSEVSSSVCRRRSGAHGGHSAVFERDIFFMFDSVGARTRKSSGPKEPTWGAYLDTVCDPAHANNFTGEIYFMLRLLKENRCFFFCFFLC